MSWRSLLLRIGDKGTDYATSDFNDHIETCFGAVHRELDHSQDDVLSFLLQCVQQLPHKIPFYATLIGLLNLENEEVVRKILGKIQADFHDALDFGSCDRIRVLMRFLTAMMCSKVLQPTSLVVVFETLLSSSTTTVGEEKGNPCWQARGDFYVTCISSCLPWGGSELTEQVPEEIERVMVGVETCMSIRRHNSYIGLSFFEEDESRKGIVEKDFLEDLWERIQILFNSGWKLDSEWVLSPENVEQFHTSDQPWEVLRSALSKTYNRICALRKEVSSLEKIVTSAERASAKAKAELEAVESKFTLVDGEPVLGDNPVRIKLLKSHAEKIEEDEVPVRESMEAKEALLAQAHKENEALFFSLYKNFSRVLIERLPDASKSQSLSGLKSTQTDEMAVDHEESSAMEVDNENERTKKSQPNSRKESNPYVVGEKEQWCLSILGYVKAFSRQYSSEIWPFIEKLDAELFTKNTHPLFLKAVYSSLRRPLNDDSSG